MSQKEIQNALLKDYKFLDCMSEEYYPGFLVAKGAEILKSLCLQIEEQEPKNLEGLYKLTHAATDEFNELSEEFYANKSEIETMARECIAGDFEFIAATYGFDADLEELIETREW